MFCYNCGCTLSEHDFCTACGADVYMYKKIMHVSNMYYNDGLEKAGVRDLTGAVTSLRQSLRFNKNHIEARNLLGLVYFEMGDTVTALGEWVISKNMQPDKNIADDYINKIQSNAGRLASINATIKKYNQALLYCNQGSKDYAVIQLKKVLSLNPRFVRAHQLLALLYMDRQDWEHAERELRKCMDIDRNNVLTLRYLKEVEAALTNEETTKSAVKRKKEEAVRYQSENEMIIQPLNVREPRRNGVSTLLNMGIGVLIGLAATYFLLVPAARQAVRMEAQETITKIGNESDTKTARIQELENKISGMNGDIAQLNKQIQDFVGEDGTLQTFEEMLVSAAAFIETGDIHAAEEDLEAIAANVRLEEMTEGFQSLYRKIFEAIGPELSAEYYKEGHEAYRTEEYAVAIEVLGKAVAYDPANMEALYELGQAYAKNDDTEDAIRIFEQVIELFPNTQRARNAQQQINSLTPKAD